jgi:hypothetical protein
MAKLSLLDTARRALSASGSLPAQSGLPGFIY